MTTVTRTPAQAAKAGGQGRPPATPPISSTSSQSGAPSEAGAPVGQGPRDTAPSSRALSERGATFKPKIHCGSKTHQTNGPCTQRKGFRTDHPGSGRCWLHGGRTPAGRQAAAREKVEATLNAMAIPAEGDPLEALQAAVERAHGAMLGAQALLSKNGTGVEVDLYMRTIRDAARVAKSAAEAINLDELVRIREREADLLEGALMRTLGRFGIAEKRQPAFLGMFREELRAALPVAEELS